MVNHAENHKLFEHLEGKWVGEGRGRFPTIDSFDYRETLTFERRDESTLSYEQRTEKRPLGQPTYQTSHWENGFIRILDTGQLELVNAQSGGRSEVLIGTADFTTPTTRITFSSRALTNDERMVATTRTFEIEGDTLKYEMTMQTTRVDKLMTHLSATLIRMN